ncbi:MAG: AMP-binding protein [Rhizobiales bacterium]|nr:AMP-binding protein [Hyphomicrobiales bacterium]
MSATQRSAGSGRRALAACALDPLLLGAARLRGDRLALSASGEGVAERSLTFAEMDGVARRIACALAECELAPGESLLIVGAADPDTVLLLLGAARAGLVAALAPAGAEADRLAAMARAVGAAAVAGPARIGAVPLGPTLLRVAADVETVRFVGCAGGEAEGAVRLDDEAFATVQQRVAAAPVVTFHDGRDGPAPVRHEQTTLAAAALDFLARSQIGAGLPLVSTISPTRFAGLVAGPIASLLSGAPLHLHAPFETASLVAALAERRAAHLVAPLALGANSRVSRAPKS